MRDNRTTDDLRAEAKELARLSKLSENPWVCDLLEQQARYSLSLAIFYEREAEGIKTAGNPATIDVCLECGVADPCGCTIA